MKLRNSILIFTAFAALGLVAYTTFSRSSPAPAVTFTSLAGEKISTGGLRGQVVVINFWATDCAVCVKEMPNLVEIYNKYRKHGFELIAVAMRHDPPNYVINYTEKNALPFKVALDPRGELARAFGEVRLTPTTIIIDKRGNIVGRILGEPDFSRLGALIEQKLAEPA